MKRASVIDDLKPKESEYKGEDGYPILFENPQIRKMLTIAGAAPSDVFFDLGCGWGQNLKIALTEFNVKKAIGIEKNTKRSQKARNRLERLGLPNEKWHLIQGKYETLLEGKSTEANLAEATIVFFGILSDPENIDSLEKTLSKGCKLVWYYNCLIPEIMPDRTEYPFYISEMPFRRTLSELDWLRRVVFWRGSSLYAEREPDSSELWDELSHDYKQIGALDFVRDYRTRLKKIVREHLVKNGRTN